MARRTDQPHDNIDPFNAGEPVLPWDDPQTEHDSEACPLDEQPYRAPSKSEDSYEAPSKKADEAKAAKAKRKEKAAAEKPAAPGRRGRTKLSLRTIILIMIVFSLAGGFISCVADGIGRAVDGISSAFDDSDDSPSYQSEPQSEFTDEEAAVRDTATARLDALKDDERLRQSIAEHLSDNLEQAFDYNAEELGIDTDLWVDYQLDSFTYTVDSAFAFDDGGDVYINANAVDMGYFVIALQSKAGSWVSDCDGKPLTDAQKQRFASEFKELLGQNPETSDRFLNFTATPDGSDWTLDEDRFYSELTSLFCY